MKKAGIVVGALAVIFLLLGLVAPTEMNVEKEIVINKPKDAVFSFVRSLKNDDQWNPWNKRDPSMQKTYEGTEGAVGAIVKWSGDTEVGEGEQEVKNIVEGERIDSELRFKKPFKDTAMAYIVTEAAGENQTKVRWGMKNKSPFPFNVICLVLNMKEKMGRDFDEGLTTLKSILEK